MATYNPIGNSEVQPDADLVTNLFQRLRDNPLAIQEGDATAPKYVFGALDDFPNSLVSSGWAELPGGFIVQWGFTTGIAWNVSQTPTLPRAFPTANFGGIATLSTLPTGLAPMNSVHMSEVTNTSITLQIKDPNFASTHSARWIVWGI